MQVDNILEQDLEFVRPIEVGKSTIRSELTKKGLETEDITVETRQRSCALLLKVLVVISPARRLSGVGSYDTQG